jgi:glucosamine-6-phosphate deaminase
MKIRILNTPQGVSRLVAGTLWQHLEAGAKHLGLATGRTMVEIYQEFRQLAQEHKSRWPWDTLKTFNLDEYVGLGPGDQESFHFFMQRHLFSHLPLVAGQNFLPDGLATDLDQECQRYENLVMHHGIDVQLLGLGINGHIGFNEPGTPFDAGTHVVRLSRETLEQNRADFLHRRPPDRAITMGIETILSAKRIILVAIGAQKAPALYETLVGSVGPHCPATALRLHQDVTVYLDWELWRRLGLQGQAERLGDVAHIENLYH